ncbi:Hypothetical predicted protein, partial [Paramuricea clavata]
MTTPYFLSLCHLFTPRNSRYWNVSLKHNGVRLSYFFIFLSLKPDDSTLQEEWFLLKKYVWYYSYLLIKKVAILRLKPMHKMKIFIPVCLSRKKPPISQMTSPRNEVFCSHTMDASDK